MNLDQLYFIFIAIITLYAIIIFFILFFLTAPYGKFTRKGWGIGIPAKYAWLIMEFPSAFVMGYLFVTTQSFYLVPIIFFGLWEIHYIHRTFIYPFIFKGRDKTFPILLIFFAIVFNSMNGFVNGYAIFYLNVHTDYQWIFDIRFVIGIFLFILGFVINKWSDAILHSLRKGNDLSYKIPYGGLFRFVSCPHYLAEIVQWIGWAILTWSIAGWVFALFTLCNLLPRAISQHRWYNENFINYPSDRKAIVPFVF